MEIPLPYRSPDLGNPIVTIIDEVHRLGSLFVVTKFITGVGMM
jgi:hypothetical protein